MQPLGTKERTLANAKTVGVGFLRGMAELFRGWGFIITTPRVWGHALFPTFVATILFGGVGAGGFYATRAFYTHLMDRAETGWGMAGAVVLALVFATLALVISFIVAGALAQPISGFALEALSKRQSAAIGRPVTSPDESFFRSLGRSLVVTVTGLAVGLPALLLLFALTAIFPPAAIVTVPLKFVVASLLCAWDFLDYPLSTRARGVSARLSWIGRNFWAVLGFGASCTLLLLIPGFGLALLPIGVAGATRLVVATESPGSEALL